MASTRSRRVKKWENCYGELKKGIQRGLMRLVADNQSTVAETVRLRTGLVGGGGSGVVFCGVFANESLKNQGTETGGESRDRRSIRVSSAVCLGLCIGVGSGCGLILGCA